jgi:hypothetical protein
VATLTLLGLLVTTRTAAAVMASTLDTLNLLDQFFRLHASTATRAELRQLAGLQGWDPIQGAEILLEGIGLKTAPLTLPWVVESA